MLSFQQNDSNSRNYGFFDKKTQKLNKWWPGQSKIELFQHIQKNYKKIISHAEVNFFVWRDFCFNLKRCVMSITIIITFAQDYFLLPIYFCFISTPLWGVIWMKNDIMSNDFILIVITFFFLLFCKWIIIN